MYQTEDQVIAIEILFYKHSYVSRASHWKGMGYYCKIFCICNKMETCVISTCMVSYTKIWAVITKLPYNLNNSIPVMTALLGYIDYVV